MINNLVTQDQFKEATDELKKSVSNGKSLVASAITNKGVATAADAAFAVMANNINSIQVGITPSGTKSITSNGTHDVNDFKYANVNVPIPSGYKRCAIGTFTTSYDGKTINCGFKPTYVMVIANIESSTYNTVDMYYNGTTRHIHIASASGASMNKTQYINPSAYGFFHSVINNSYADKTAYYIACQ